MFKLIPAYKDYLWGGTKLKTHYGKQSELPIVAESWELSTHQDGTTLIQLDGNMMSFKEYIQRYGNSVLGSSAQVKDEMPILVKLIDAKESLSVQVHPDDAYALQNENSMGKTEMWYILEAEPGANLVYGFKETLSPEVFETHLRNNTLESVLNYVDVHKGDVFFIEPGTMHAIGKGIVIAEIQQCSNITYRVYDYGRIGADGKPRPLHIEKALQVTNLAAHETNELAATKEDKDQEIKCLATCSYFTVFYIKVTQRKSLNADEKSFHSLLVTEGEVVIKNRQREIHLRKGESCFIPAYTGEYTIEGVAELILSTL